MNKPHLNATCFLLLLLFLTACTQHELPAGKEQEKEKEAQLTFSLSLPELVADSRGVVTDYPDTPATWTEWEKVVDGRHLYHVAVFLVDESGEVVGKDVTLGGNSDNTIATDSLTATVTFTEGLSYGNYTLYAIANYSAYSSDGKSYSGLPLSGFTANATTFNELLDYTLDAGEDRICSQVPQPLTLMKQVELHPGMNQISGELIRTYARIRIEVRNQSAVSELTVNSLSFSNQFAKRTAKLFEENATRDDRGTLSVNSTDNLQSFEQGLKVPAILVSEETTTVNSKVIFDAYILESKEEASDVYYTYTLGVEYKGKTYEVPTQLVSETPYTTTNSISTNCDEYYFLIENTRWGKCLYDDNSNSQVSYLWQGKTLDQLKNNVLANYVWRLIPTNNTNQYYIQNVASENYIGSGNNQNYVTITGENNSRAYTLSEYSSLLRIGYNYRNNTYYLNDYSGAGQRIGVYTAAGDNGSRFRFYPVEGGRTENAAITSTVVLNTINPETAKVEAVREIKRNDFINVLVTVTYNEETGDFEFDVNDWETGGGNVEFN